MKLAGRQPDGWGSAGVGWGEEWAVEGQSRTGRVAWASSWPPFPNLQAGSAGSPLWPNAPILTGAVCRFSVL